MTPCRAGPRGAPGQPCSGSQHVPLAAPALGRPSVSCLSIGVRRLRHRERARMPRGMDPSRKRAIRLTVALTVAVLLASALIYTSFSAGRDELTASQLVNRAKPHTEYILAGTVVQSHRTASTLYFRVRDPKRDLSVPVSYQGSIPGPFETGRGVLVSVRKTPSGVYAGQPGSLTTKYPSKYQAVAAGSST